MLAACESTANQPVTAHLAKVTPEVKQELQQHIQQLIGGTTVKLADNVFMDSSKLYIEQAVLRDAQGRPLAGRHQQSTVTFSLWLEKGQCLLKHNASGNVLPLKQATCTTE